MTHKWTLAILAIVYGIGLFTHLTGNQLFAPLMRYFPTIFAFIGFVLILKAFTEKGNAIAAWLTVFIAQLFITFSLAMYNPDFGNKEILIYLSGVVLSALLGYYTLRKTEAIDNDIQLNRFHGYAYEKPRLNFLFLVAALGISGLPFTPTYIGIDVIFSNIHMHDTALIVFIALSFLFIELAILRIYARVYLGQHKKMNHPIAFRSS